MKIHEYNEMMAYLTRPSYVSGGRVGFKTGGYPGPKVYPKGTGYYGETLEKYLPRIKKLYLEGTGTPQIGEKLFGQLGVRKTTIDAAIKSMINGTAPVKITSTEFANKIPTIGKTAMGPSPAKIILNNPKLKEQFRKFANAPDHTVLDSMEYAGKLASEATGKKIGGYTSRSGFIDSGLRKLITKKVQLGKPTLNPEVTKRLNKLQNILKSTPLPKTEIRSDSPILKVLANKLGTSQDQLHNTLRALKVEYGTPTGRISLLPEVGKAIKRFPEPKFMTEMLKAKGYGPSTIKAVGALERAASSITEAGSQLEHALPKSLIKEFNLPRKYLLTAERTSNFLNQFKKQFDNQLLTAAKKHAAGTMSYPEYKKEVARISKIVADKTGGYKIGHVDFVDGKPVPVTPQQSILQAESKQIGKQTTGLKNYFKNAIHHNKLYENYKKNPTDSAFGTLRPEIAKGRYNFVKEIEAEKNYKIIKNFKGPEDFYKFYQKSPNNAFFKALTKASSMLGGKGKLITAGVASSTLLATALAADELGDSTEINKAESVDPTLVGAAAVGSLGVKPVRRTAWKATKAIGKGIGKLAAIGAVPLELGFMGSAAEQGKSPLEVLATPLVLEGAARENRIRKIMGDEAYVKMQEHYQAEADPVFYGEGEATEKRLDPNLEILRAMAEGKVQQEDDERKEAARQFNLKSDETMFNQGGRVGLAKGPKDPGRRLFIKGVAAATMLPIIGKYFKLAKPAAKAFTAYTGPVIEKIKGLEWVQFLAKRLWNEGDDVTKTAATMERQVVKRGTLESGDEVDMIYDQTSGNVNFEVTPKKTKTGYGYETKSGAYNREYGLDYKAGEVIEEGKHAGKKTKAEIEVGELKPYRTSKDDVELDFDITTVDDAMSDLTELEAFAKKKTVKQIHKKKGTKPKEVDPGIDPTDFFPDPMDYD